MFPDQFNAEDLLFLLQDQFNAEDLLFLLQDCRYFLNFHLPEEEFRTHLLI